MTYLEDERPSPFYNVDFGRVRSIGFVPAWTVLEVLRELAKQFTDEATS